MKRDWDVIRAVLLEVQNMTQAERNQSSYAAEDDDDDAQARHAFLLYDAGFLSGVSADDMSGRELISPDLTWSGHELLASIESRPVWKRVKQMAKEKGLELSFDAVKLLAAKALAQVVS